MACLKEYFRTIVKLNSVALGTMYLSNKYINSISSSKNMLKPGGGKYYRWQHGDVFYHKQGKGNPLVLLHNLDPAFSSYEWNEIIDELSSYYTVYSIDLPGCGRSSKENTSYTNYFYMLFLSSFIRNVVKKKCSVMASGYSSSFAIMAASTDPSLIGRIIAINPYGKKELLQTIDKKSKAASILLSVPIIGTTIYNITECRDNIDLAFTEKYMYNPFYSQKRFTDAFYEGAHFHEGKGKYLLSSIKGKYMTVNIEKALGKCGDKIVILYGDRSNSSKQIALRYQMKNNSIKALAISDTKLLPHMEKPELFMQVFLASRKL